HQRQFHDPAFLFSPAYAEKLASAAATKAAETAAKPASGGTVGAIAVDRDGHLFAATSTGGTCCKVPGRVGDSPMIGCGCYPHEQAGGVSCTGGGEAIMKIVMAKTAVDFLRAGRSEQQAADESIALLAQRTGGTGGLILMGRSGTPAFAFNTPQMV